MAAPRPDFPALSPADPVPGFGCSRYAPVEYLPGVSQFSDDPELVDELSVVRLLKRHPQILKPLEAHCTPEYETGRRRMDGSWVLMFLAFMLSGRSDMDAFHQHNIKNKPLWRAAGFKGEIPSSRTMYLRFVELEQYVEVFERAVAALIRQARKHEPRIGRAVSVDGTAIASHASLEHFCHPDSECGRKRKRKHKGSPVKRIGDDLVPDLREHEAAQPEEEIEELPTTALRPLSDAEVAALDLPEEDLYWGHQKDRPFLWFKQNGHLYRLRDIDASPRAYATGKKKYWIGHNAIAATDVLTGLPMVIQADTARRQEWDSYPGVITTLHERMGCWPQAVAADRGFVTKDNYEFNTRRGIGSALPWREPQSGVRRHHYESERFDRHGVLRCEHCGGPCEIRGDGLGFYFDEAGEPRVRGRCKLQGTEYCKSVQSISCSEEWRMLQPLALTDEVYAQLRHGHASTERVHFHMRQRYTLGGKETIIRSKRFGVACQKLRIAAVLFLEWFRASLRNGWLGSHKRRNTAKPVLRNAGKRLLAVMESRLKWALDLPYGEAARMAGLGEHGPPGRDAPRRTKKKR